MRIRLLVLSSLVLVAPAAAAQQGAEAPRGTGQNDFSRDEFERALLASHSGPAFAAILRNYPVEGRALLDRMHQRSLAVREDEEAVLDVIGEEHDEFLRRLADDVAKAPVAALLDLARVRLATAEALQAVSLAHCANFVVGSGSGRDYGEAATRLLATASVAFVDTAGAGRREPHIRGRGTVTPADREAFARSLAALNPGADVLALFRDEAALQEAPPELQCRMGIVLYRALLSLRPDIAANLLAGLTEAQHRPRVVSQTGRD